MALDLSGTTRKGLSVAVWINESIAKHEPFSWGPVDKQVYSYGLYSLGAPR